MWKLQISQNAVTISHMTKYSAALSLSYSLNFASTNLINVLIIHHHGFLKVLKNIIRPSHCSSGYWAVFKIVLATSLSLTLFHTFKTVHKVGSFFLCTAFIQNLLSSSLVLGRLKMAWKCYRISKTCVDCCQFHQ